MRQTVQVQSAPHLQPSFPTAASAGTAPQVQSAQLQCDPQEHSACVTSTDVAHLQALPPGHGTSQPQESLQAAVVDRTLPRPRVSMSGLAEVRPPEGSP